MNAKVPSWLQICAIGLCSFLSLKMASGQTLVGWNVTGVSESSSNLSATPWTIATYLNASPLSRGSGAALPGGTPKANTFGASGFSSASLSQAVSNNDYFAFSIAADEGHNLSISSVDFAMSRTGTGPTDAALLSSVDGFDPITGTIHAWTFDSTEVLHLSVPLNSGSFSNLTGSVEFRIYGFGGGTATTAKLRFEDISGNDLAISGSVSAVPEPAAFAAVTGGVILAIALLMRRLPLRHIRAMRL